MMKMVRTRSAVAGLAVCEILVYTSGSERPQRLDEGAQSAAVGSSPWDTYAKSSLLTPESFDESRVVVLIPLHPPKFEMAERYFDWRGIRGPQRVDTIFSCHRRMMPSSTAASRTLRASIRILSKTLALHGLTT